MAKLLKTIDSPGEAALRSTLLFVEHPGDIAELADDWNSLASRVPGHSLSQTATFAAIALALAGRQKKECFVITVRQAGRLVGIWSLARRRHSFHNILEPFSSGIREELAHPLLDPQWGRQAAGEIKKLALSIKADRIHFYNLPRAGEMDNAVKDCGYFQRTDFVQSYLVDRNIFKDWEAVEASISKSFRSQLKRYEAKLSERGVLEYGWSRTPEEAARIFDYIYETKREWLRRKKLRSPWLAEEEVREFFREIFKSPAFGRAPFVSWIKLNGEPIAGEIYLSTDDLVEALVTTFDPRYSDVSCGNLLTRHGIRLSLESGRSYDIGLIAAPYKERWAASPRYFTTRIVKTSLLGLVPTPAELKRSLRMGKISRAAKRLARAVKDGLLPPHPAWPGQPIRWMGLVPAGAARLWNMPPGPEKAAAVREQQRSAPAPSQQVSAEAKAAATPPQARASAGSAAWHLLSPAPANPVRAELGQVFQGTIPGRTMVGVVVQVSGRMAVLATVPDGENQIRLTDEELAAGWRRLPATRDDWRLEAVLPDERVLWSVFIRSFDAAQTFFAAQQSEIAKAGGHIRVGNARNATSEQCVAFEAETFAGHVMGLIAADRAARLRTPPY